jgi:two-component system, NarL family, invasion response regulator UvrY
MIRIVLVDDHALVRTGFRAILQQEADFDVVGDAENGEVGVELVRKLKPDVVLMDVNLPGISGLEAANRILHYLPKTRVIAVTGLEDSPFPRRFLEAGAAGFVTKACPADELLRAVRTAASGGRHISQAVAQTMALDFVGGKQGSPFDNLTKREMEIVLALAQGEEMMAIAARLNLSNKTIASHKYNALHKLQVENDVALSRLAHAHGLLDATGKARK